MFPLSHTHVPIVLRGWAAWLGRTLKPFTSGFQNQSAALPVNKEHIHEELCSTMSRGTVGTGGNTFDFLWYCSPHPTFLLQASHPACTPQPPLITRLEFAINCFLHSPFFFTGSDQENVWERRLPIGAGEWHSAVRVSTPPVSGTPLQPATRAEVCFPQGLDFCVSVADISQTDLRLGRCWFVVPVNWQDSRGSSVPRRLE